MTPKWEWTQTNVPVGDAPREADILLLRRNIAQPTPFRGLWRHLTTWNILEFKGPTVDARLRDLHLLAELGLGIHRRLNQERRRQKETLLEPEQASFWYIVRSLGRRFLPNARRRLGQLEEIETGLRRSQMLQHPVFLISSETFASEPDSVPLHLLLKRSAVQERELAHLVVEQSHCLEWYGSVLSGLHPEGWKEVKDMAATKRKGLQWDFTAIVEDIGVEKLIKSIGAKKIIEDIGVEKLVESSGAKKKQSRR